MADRCDQEQVDDAVASVRVILSAGEDVAVLSDRSWQGAELVDRVTKVLWPNEEHPTVLIETLWEGAGEALTAWLSEVRVRFDDHDSEYALAQKTRWAEAATAYFRLHPAKVTGRPIGECRDCGRPAAWLGRVDMYGSLPPEWDDVQQVWWRAAVYQTSEGRQVVASDDADWVAAFAWKEIEAASARHRCPTLESEWNEVMARIKPGGGSPF